MDLILIFLDNKILKLSIIMINNWLKMNVISTCVTVMVLHQCNIWMINKKWASRKGITPLLCFQARMWMLSASFWERGQILCPLPTIRILFVGNLLHTKLERHICLLYSCAIASYYFYCVVEISLINRNY